MACFCCGDIEDHDTGEEYTMRCTCCDNSVKDQDDDGPDDQEEYWQRIEEEMTRAKNISKPSTQP